MAESKESNPIKLTVGKENKSGSTGEMTEEQRNEAIVITLSGFVGTPWLEAATRDNDADKVKEILANEKYKVKETEAKSALHIAALHGQTQILSLILEKFEHLINSQTNDGFTPLYIASSKGHLDIISLLLQNRKCSVNKADNHGFTPLHAANMCVHSEAVSMLLKNAQCSVNLAENTCGLTPLHIAVASESIDNVCRLLEHPEIKVNAAENTSGQTSLHTAAALGHEDIVCKLLKHPACCLTARTSEGYTALHVACREGQKRVASVLLQSSEVLINSVDEGGFAPLHWALFLKHQEIVHLFLKHQQCSVSIPAYHGTSVLQMSILYSDKETVSMVLQHEECEVNSKDDNGLTPLHVAAMVGDKEKLKLLIKHPQCSINAVEWREGITPLQVAVKCQHLDVATLFLKEPNINASSQDKDGETVLTKLLSMDKDPVLKCSKLHFDCIKTLVLVQKVNINSPHGNLAYAVRCSSSEVVKFLLEHNADPNSSVDGVPALHVAIQIHSLPKCLMLLDKGADIEVRYKTLSPLEYAVLWDAPEIVDMLVAKTRRQIDIPHILKKCGDLSHDEPLLCQAARLGSKSLMEMLITEHSLEEADFSGLNACHFSYRHPLITEWLLKERPATVEKYEDPYKFTKDMEICHCLGTNFKPAQISCDEMFKLATAFKNETEEVEEITSTALKMLRDVSENMPEQYIKFNPVIRGSVAEGTKVGLPNELDVVCFLTNVRGFRVITTNLSDTHRRLMVTDSSPLITYCYEENCIDLKKFGDAFYDFFNQAISPAREKIYGGKHGFLFLPRMYFNISSKISSINVTWRGTFFKDLAIKMDIVPAVIYDNFELDKHVPLSNNKLFYFITKCSGLHKTDIPISYSDSELFMIRALPKNIKDGYILAKACRDIRVCFPNESLPICEPIQTDNILSSYKLKLSLLYLLKQAGNDDAIRQDKQTKEQWAKKIYAKLAEFLKTGFIPSYYEPNNRHCVIFKCNHELNLSEESRSVCCQMRHMMLVLCRQIISFLDLAVNGKTHEVDQYRLQRRELLKHECCRRVNNILMLI